MKSRQTRVSWTAVLAALGASVVMLPVHADDAPLTSTHEPEQGLSPGHPQGQDAQGSMQGQDAQGSAQDAQAPVSVHQPEMSQGQSQQQGMHSQQSRDAHGTGMHGSRQGARSGGLTREEVKAEAEAWRQAGLLELMMDAEDTSAWLEPEVQRLRDQVSREVHTARGGMDLGTRDAGGTQDAGGAQDASGTPRTEWQQEQMQRWQQQEPPGHPTEGEAGQMPGGFTNEGGGQQQHPAGNGGGR